LLDSPTIERAIVEENGNIKHLLPPEYHGDPIRGEILAFELSVTIFSGCFQKLDLIQNCLRHFFK
jgi:hypothetical protein